MKEDFPLLKTKTASQKNIAIYKVIINAAVDVIQMATVDKISRGKLIKISHEDLHGNICGMIELTGDVSGKVGVSFGKELAKYLLSKFARCKPDELLDKELYEGAGEIINQIAGKAKTILWEQGLKTEMSLPNTMKEYDSKTCDQIDGSMQAVKFNLDDHVFTLILNLSINE